MVLQEAISETDDPNSIFSDGSSDTTQTDYEGLEVWQIPTSSLPRPYGLIGRQSWQNPKQLKLLQQSLTESRTILGRPFRQEEVDALAYKYAKSITVGSFCVPTGYIFGSVWAYAGRATYRFPGLEPGKKKWFNPNKFSFLRGEMARAAWHGLRAGVYVGLTGFIGLLFWGSVALSMDISATVTDPRLKDFCETLKAKAQEANGQLKQKIPARQRSPNTQDGRMDNQAINAATTWDRVKQSRQAEMTRGYAAAGDDMSPTGGAFADDFGSPDNEHGIMSDRQMQARERRMEYNSRVAERESRMATRAPPEMSRTTSEPRQPERRDSVQVDGAWERLRREAAMKSDDGTHSERQRESTVGDGFTFPSRDGDREMAQREAQRDFDARLEKERRGGNFNESRNGRW